MKLLELPFVYEVREQYLELREELQRKKAVQALMREYPDEIEDVDDAALFWLGIASGQDELGELNVEYRQKTLAALEAWGEDTSSFDAGELDFLSEKSGGKKRTSSNYWTWKPGDVYMYDLSGPRAESAKISDCSVIIYVIGYHSVSRRSNDPVVYLLLNPSKNAPQSKEELESYGYIDLSTIWRRNDKKYCKTVFVSNGKREFEDFSTKLQYIGNYPEISGPENQATLQDELSYAAPISFEGGIAYSVGKGDVHYLSKS